MKTATRYSYHSFTAYAHEDIIRLSITQFSRHDVEDLRIISESSTNLSKSEAERVIQVLQGAIESAEEVVA